LKSTQRWCLWQPYWIQYYAPVGHYWLLPPTISKQRPLCQKVKGYKRPWNNRKLALFAQIWLKTLSKLKCVLQ
jgi:hypothetical protein